MRSGSGRSHALVRAALIVTLAAVGGIAPSHGNGQAASGVLRIASPRDDVRDDVRAARERRRAHRAEWPEFLADGRTHARIERQGLRTSARARAARAAKAARGAGAAPDTLDLVVVRVGFAANRAPQFSSMDPSGDFRLTADTTVVIDPPPHGVPYFEAQILGLADYYRSVSHGQIEVRGQVFPPDGQPSVKLSDIADYGPGPDGRWTLELLEAWFRDAVAAFDSAATGALDLRAVDAFAFVHPGSDLQSDINRDSPNDLPTFFVTLADSIPAMGGQAEIRSGLVIPETLNQDGFLGGILGSFCHEFGHALGLPDWYDTYFGLPAIGEWDLMDSGNGMVFAFQVEGSEEVQIAFGLLPSGLSAFSRVLLGLDEPYALQAGADSVVLRPANTTQGTGPRIARLDVSADEYFLVENRRDYLYERPDDFEACPYLNRDSATGVVLWMSRDDPAKPARARRNSGEYDFFISSPTAPDGAFGACGQLGFGLLVWHVDERPFAEGYGFNVVNGDERMRALRLVEASGDFEIGDWRNPSQSFVGDGWNDPFRAGFRTTLGASTVPNNWNNDWAHSGWEITDIRSVSPESHQLLVRVHEGVAGWPRILRANPDSLLFVDPRGAVVAPLAGSGVALCAADSNGVWAFGTTGARRVVTHAVLPHGLAHHPALAPGDPAGTLAATDADRVWLWDARTGPGDTLDVRTGFPIAVPGGCSGRLVLLDAAAAPTPGALVETAAGAWVRVDATGVGSTFDVDAGTEQAVVGPLLSGAAPGLALVGTDRVVFGGFAGEPTRSVPHGLGAAARLLVAGGAIAGAATQGQVVLLAPDGGLRIVDADRGLWSGVEDLPRDEYLGLALADVDGDGTLDVVAASATRVVGITGLGARLPRTPFVLQDAFALQNQVAIVAGPIVADVAGDALPEILVTTDLGLVYAFDAAGRVLDGYPRKLLPDLFPAALVAGDLDGDLVPEIVGVSAVAAAATRPGGGSARAGWTSLGGVASRTAFVATPSPAGARARILAAERPIVAYPNPARGGEVRLRLTSQQSGGFSLAIYTLEGERVFERNGTLATGTQEIAWRPSGLAPGVYLCRFVSAAAGVRTPIVEPITILR